MLYCLHDNQTARRKLHEPLSISIFRWPLLRSSFAVSFRRLLPLSPRPLSPRSSQRRGPHRHHDVAHLGRFRSRHSQGPRTGLPRACLQAHHLTARRNLRLSRPTHPHVRSAIHKRIAIAFRFRICQQAQARPSRKTPRRSHRSIPHRQTPRKISPASSRPQPQSPPMIPPNPNDSRTYWTPGGGGSNFLANTRPASHSRPATSNSCYPY